MSGGGSEDPNVFNRELFGFRKFCLAPTVVLISDLNYNLFHFKNPEEVALYGYFTSFNFAIIEGITGFFLCLQQVT